MQLFKAVFALAAVMALGACNQNQGIDDSEGLFTGIPPEAMITLTGTEPFWSLTIIPQENGLRATYITPENQAGETFAVERFAGNSGLGFSGKLFDKAVQIAITPEQCSDTMSDRLYPFSAIMALEGETLFGCAFTDIEPAIPTGSE